MKRFFLREKGTVPKNLLGSVGSFSDPKLLFLQLNRREKCLRVIYLKKLLRISCSLSFKEVYFCESVSIKSETKVSLNIFPVLFDRTLTICLFVSSCISIIVYSDE